MAQRKMRIAIAGTNSLALMIATYITKLTQHQIVVLSRYEHPTLEDEDYDVLTVDYDDQSVLQHAVMGVHTIISTVTGAPQVALLQAAIAQGVRRFAPAEFEGPLSARPANDDPLLDRGKQQIRELLDGALRGQIQYTVFNCGVLMERFRPGGLQKDGLHASFEYGYEGDYIVNVRNLKAFAPVVDQNDQDVELCLTAAQDVAALIVKAIDMRSWPRELSMVGERMTMKRLLNIVLRVRGQDELHRIGSRYPSVNQLTMEYWQAVQNQDEVNQQRIAEHLATVAGRYVINGNGTLRDAFPSHRPIKFEAWLKHYWAQHPVEDN